MITTLPNSPLLAPVGRHEDERGVIHHLIDGVPTTSMLDISCSKGAVRANHYHKDDFHVCYLNKGRMYYYERPVGSLDKPTRIELSDGDVFYTPPMVEHAMEFLEDSNFICLSKLSRSSANYESDTIRVPSLVDSYNQ